MAHHFVIFFMICQRNRAIWTVNRLVTVAAAYLCDSFLIDSAMRYDIKGKKYIDTPIKYYFTDMGLRNARLNFRQLEETHAMENVIFNELKLRGFNVDVGVIEINSTNEKGNRVRKQLEIDFVCKKGSKLYNIQSVMRCLIRQRWNRNNVL